jgi:uncharacterized protein (DUF2267 family)
MSATGLSTFDKTLQQTNVWLRALMDQLYTDDRHIAYLVLRATLHALRDRIGPENAVHLGAQLPMLLRGLFYEGWHMAGTPTREHNRQQFLDHVRLELPPPLAQDAERAVRAVFTVMLEKVEPGEVAKVIGLLPADLRDLWPRIAQRD